jgi:hypothetical protein
MFVHCEFGGQMKRAARLEGNGILPIAARPLFGVRKLASALGEAPCCRPELDYHRRV